MQTLLGTAFFALALTTTGCLDAESSFEEQDEDSVGEDTWSVDEVPSSAGGAPGDDVAGDTGTSSRTAAGRPVEDVTVDLTAVPEDLAPQAAAAPCRVQILARRANASSDGANHWMHVSYKVRNRCASSRKIGVVVQYCPDGADRRFGPNAVHWVDASMNMGWPCNDQGPRYKR